MATFFTIDRANARIPEVRELLLLLRAQREELIALRDRSVAPGGGDGPEAAPRGADGAGDPGARDADAGEPRTAAEGTTGDGSTLTGLEQGELLRLRVKGIVDQMGASVARIDAWGITLRDIATGLIDFPALVGGRQVWLCWRLGEEDVAWWHELEAGVGGRRPLTDLPAAAGRQ